MRGVGLVARVAAALLAGCYSPTLQDCDYLCSNARECPDGLTCDETSGICRDPAAVAAGLVCANAADAAPVCDWAMVAPSNFDSSMLPPMRTPWRITGQQVYDTSGTGSGGPPGVAHSWGGVTLLLVHVASFIVPAGAELQIVGPVPLIIVADAIVIEGTIDVYSGANLATCAGATHGLDACVDSPGGGGGGFGGAGGDGSVRATFPPTDAGLGGDVSGNAQLTPLVGGCYGARGGHSDNEAWTAGVGGEGGGALQLTARGRITIAGQIRANGRGGDPGRSNEVLAACATNVNQSAGGGGGGSGGAILIEGCDVEVTDFASLCASGGAGGGGSVSAAPAGAGEPGADGSCLAAAAGGAAESDRDNVGGDGGYGGMADGQTAPPPTSQFYSGAGGGGGVGRIRIHSANAANLGATATIVPSALID